MADIPPTFPPIPVVWVDPAKEGMASCTEALEESRVEDSWTIQTDSDWAKLIGKKLGIQRDDGSYVRGWLCPPPGGAQGSALLRESNRSDEVVEVHLQQVVRVDIIERRSPPLLRFKTADDRLSLWNALVTAKLTRGERMDGRVEISGGSDPHLVLRSSTGEKTTVPWDRVIAIESRDEEPSPKEETPRGKRKRPKAGRQTITRPDAPPSKGHQSERCFPKLLFREGSESVYFRFSPGPSSEARRIVACRKDGGQVIVDRDTTGRLVEIEIRQCIGGLGWKVDRLREYLLKVDFRPQTDSVLTLLPLTKNHKAEHVAGGISLVYDLEGRLIGIEIAEVSNRADLAALGVGRD